MMLLNNEQYLTVFEKIVKSQNPSSESLPPVLAAMPQIFQLLVYKALRPEKMIEHCTNFIKNTLG